MLSILSMGIIFVYLAINAYVMCNNGTSKTKLIVVNKTKPIVKSSSSTEGTVHNPIDISNESPTHIRMASYHSWLLNYGKNVTRLAIDHQLEIVQESLNVFQENRGAIAFQACNQPNILWSNTESVYNELMNRYDAAIMTPEGLKITVVTIVTSAIVDANEYVKQYLLHGTQETKTKTNQTKTKKNKKTRKLTGIHTSYDCILYEFSELLDAELIDLSE